MNLPLLYSLVLCRIAILTAHLPHKFFEIDGKEDGSRHHGDEVCDWFSQKYSLHIVF